jgi:D-alanyl-D-alanine carboxypeptidase
MIIEKVTHDSWENQVTRRIIIPLSCGGGYWSHEGDVPGYNTIGAVSSDGRTTVVLSLNSNVNDPVLAAEYHLVDHVMCHRDNN